MKIIEQSVEIIPQEAGLEGIYRQIEKAGRVCYKSEDKITENSAKEFVDRMINSGHWAMLEHGTVYLYLPPYAPLTFYKYRDNKYSKFIQIRDSEIPKPRVHTFVTTNYRVLVENNWLDDLQYICEPTEYHEKRISVKFICNKVIANEFVRHRVFSFAQESTRYCNYNTDKFNNELTFIKPSWLAHNEDVNATSIMLESLCIAEKNYLGLIKDGCKPQEARDILPLSTKTELFMTGFMSDWKDDFFELRCSLKAHPDACALATDLKAKFEKLC